MIAAILAASLTGLTGLTGCRASVPPAAKEVLTWHPVGSWSGRGNSQTQSFTSETGSLRVRWETRNETAGGQGRFRLTLHSAISGRPLAVVADQAGVARGSSEIDEDPRVFYLVVESANIDWTCSVEEGGVGRVGRETSIEPGRLRAYSFGNIWQAAGRTWPERRTQNEGRRNHEKAGFFVFRLLLSLSRVQQAGAPVERLEGSHGQAQADRTELRHA